MMTVQQWQFSHVYDEMHTKALLRKETKFNSTKKVSFSRYKLPDWKLPAVPQARHTLHTVLYTLDRRLCCPVSVRKKEI